MIATHDAPQTVMGRLSEIEQDLAHRQNDFEQAADERARLIRDWEKRLAICGMRASASSADRRRAMALVAAIEQDDLYERLSDAEARYDALRVATRVLEQRATIGMSILRAQGRS